jgi:hypothetical protein
MTAKEYETKHTKFIRHQILPWKSQCGENQLRGGFIGNLGELL